MEQITKAMSVQAVARELGQRLAHMRLQRNVTQQDLADNVGVARATIVQLERGQGKLSNLVAALMALDAAEYLENFLPQPAPSPIELLKLQGKQRQRASGRHRGDQRPEVDW